MKARVLVRAVVTSAVLVALLAACDDSERTPAPAVSPVPSGPLVVYAAQAAAASPQGSFPLRVGIYDLGSGHERVIDAPGCCYYEYGAAVAGDTLAVIEGREVVAYGLDGAERWRRTVGDAVSGVAGSPDGSLLALTFADANIDACDHGGCIPAAQTGYVAFVDPATGDDVRTVFQNNTPVFAEFDGHPARPVWRDDNRGVVIGGDTGSERPGSLATVFVDGSVVEHEHFGYPSVSPDGRHIADGPIPEMCSLSFVRHDFRLIDLDANVAITAVIVEAPATVSGAVWSPDGRELIYGVAPTEVRDGCELAAGEPTGWGLLSADEPPQSSVDPFAVMDGWGDHLVEYRCHGERVVQQYCAGSGAQDPLDLYVDGTHVASGTLIKILDIIEQPDDDG